jgi:hypothetical protein
MKNKMKKDLGHQHSTLLIIFIADIHGLAGHGRQTFKRFTGK